MVELGCVVVVADVVVDSVAVDGDCSDVVGSEIDGVCVFVVSFADD